MTLNDLLADFEAAKAKADPMSKRWTNYSPDDVMKADLFSKLAAAFQELGWPYVIEPLKNLYKAAQLYVIARDQGMNAAMMWKLAN